MTYSLRHSANPLPAGLSILVFVLWHLLLPDLSFGISVSKGDIALEFAAEDIDGGSVSLSDFRGRIVFVAFWPSWCSRCREEMEFLKNLIQRYPELVFLAVNGEAEDPDEEATQRMRQAIAAWEIPFKVVIDRGLLIWDLYQINTLPTSSIVVPDGKIAFAEPNFYFDSPKNIETALIGLSGRRSPSEPVPTQ